jgi:hypothetical protein
VHANYDGRARAQQRDDVRVFELVQVDDRGRRGERVVAELLLRRGARVEQAGGVQHADAGHVRVGIDQRGEREHLDSLRGERFAARHRVRRDTAVARPARRHEQHRARRLAALSARRRRLDRRGALAHWRGASPRAMPSRITPANSPARAS